MTNLTKIKKAWSMGWSAVLITERGKDKWIVVAVHPKKKGILLNAENKIKSMGVKDVEGFKILEWKYAGELAGNSPIPKNQKFRFKSNPDHIVDGWYGDKKEMCILDDYDKSEIEPVFD